MDTKQILDVRRFNRAITARIGVLASDYLGSGRPLGEARVLFEIGPAGTTVRDLRARLALDSGYLSRILRGLEAGQLIQTRPDEADARVRRVALTASGEKAWQALDRQSNDLAASLLAPLGATQRNRLVAAMAEVERFLRASAVVIAVEDPFSDDARACINAYFCELQARFDEGFDPGLTVSADPEELVPPRGLFVVARLDGEAVGCGALKIQQDGHGELKRMWVAQPVRGLGIAQRLLTALEAHAAAAGIRVLRLDTHRALTEARALYGRNGYTEVPPYNTNPYADLWFEKRLANGRQADEPPVRPAPC